MPAFYPDRQTTEQFRFALVDATQRDALPPSWKQAVIAPSFLKEDTDRCPMLVDLCSMAGNQRAEWCDALHHETLNREETRVSLLLASASSLNATAQHLAQRLVVRGAGQSHPMQWRFFDPGTFLQMPRVLGLDGMSWLMGPVFSVAVPWAGEWTCLSRPKVDHPHDFQLAEDHIAGLLRIGVINRVLAQGAPPKNASHWVDQSAALDTCVRQGQERDGLLLQADLVSHALHAHTVHPAIHTHPRMRALLQTLHSASPEDELNYQELTCLLEPDDWQQMAAELEQLTPQEALPS